MATYGVGSKVVHPFYGAGTVARIAQKTIGDVQHAYYVIWTAPGPRSMQLMVPVRKAEELGLRQVGAPKALRQVLDACEVPPTPGEVEPDYRTRQTQLSSLIKTGSFAKIAHAVRILTYLGAKRPLGMTDRRMLDSAKEALASELALACDQEMSEARQEIDTRLDEMLAAHT